MFTSFPFAFWRGVSGGGSSGLGYRYGYEFDGVDESVSIPGSLSLNSSEAFSFSFWFKLPVTGNVTEEIINYPGVSNAGIVIRLLSGQLNMIVTGADNTRADAKTNLYYNQDEWYHVVWTKNTGQDWTDLTCYVDGVPVATSLQFQNTLSSNTAIGNNELFIGGVTSMFDGRVDDVQFYDFELNATQVSDIYNSGYVTAPTAAPIHHWKLGEEDTFSTNWTVKDSVGSLDGTSVNMEEVDRKLGVAYSLEFDGVDEAVSFGDILETEYNEPVSWAFWFRPIASGGDIIQKMSNANSYRGFNITMDGSKPQFRLINTVSSNWIRKRGNTDLTIGQWFHVVCTYDGSGSNAGAKIYIDGTEETYGFATGTLSATILNSNPLEFNRSTTYSFLTRSNINLMEVSQYTSELSASDVALLYNTTGVLNGVPIDPRDVGLSPNFYCPMVGASDSYDGTNWTITDEIAGNNGTSVNMEEADKTSETP